VQSILLHIVQRKCFFSYIFYIYTFAHLYFLHFFTESTVNNQWICSNLCLLILSYYASIYFYLLYESY